MKDIREFIKNNVLVADGASGTYFATLTGRSNDACELLNCTNPDLVFKMHRQYIKAGARMLLTNTFGASAAGGSIGGDFDKTAGIINSGVEIARRAVGDSENVYVAADIGPLPEAGIDGDILSEEYQRIASAFIKAGMNTFVFETFASAEFPVKTAQYIRKMVPDAFIAISFAVMPDGFTRTGESGKQLVDTVKSADCTDAVGFNCCSGPAHLLNYAKTVDFGGLIPLLMPNAGYPQREADESSPLYDGVIYAGAPEYFGQRLSEAPAHGFRILGGCCGTTPRHIECLNAAVAQQSIKKKSDNKKTADTNKEYAQNGGSSFLQMLDNAVASGRKLIIVELDPPFNSDCTKVEAAAQAAKEFGADAVTIADSPMARPRADSVTVAARIKRETGMDVIPHICCRDKNINAIKSALIAAHMEGIRNVLAVTGDPVPDTERGSVKSVFNLNSEGLCRFVSSLNSDIFSGNEMMCGCAFNVNARNIDMELARLEKKAAAGARFALTQPLFTESSFEALKRARSFDIKVIAGILTPVSYKNAVFLANEMPGFSIPEEYLARFSPDMTREEGEAAGVSIAAEIIEHSSQYVDGYYFIVPFNRINVIQPLVRSCLINCQ